MVRLLLPFLAMRRRMPLVIPAALLVALGLSAAPRADAARTAKAPAERAKKRASRPAGATPKDAAAAARRPARPKPDPALAAAKFHRVGAFADKLPALRRDVEAALASPARDRATAHAAIVRIMDTMYVRVGSERYARRLVKPTFGASSLRRRHVQIRGTSVTLRFRGKSGVDWEKTVDDPLLAAALAPFLKGPGARLFQVDGQPIDERDIVAYLAPYGAQPKDFRTHHANALLDLELARLGDPPSKQKLNAAIKAVAAELGHSPSVSRSAYLEPAKIEAYMARANAARAPPALARGRRGGAAK